MAKKKGKRKAPAGPFKVQPGKCRVVKGTVKVCVSKSGVITYSGPRGKVTKTTPKKRGTKKKAPAKKSPGVKLTTGQIVKPTKASPRTTRGLRTVPKTVKQVQARVKKCRSAFVNVTRKKAPSQCSCVVVTTKGKPALQTLRAGPCPGARDMSGQAAIKAFRGGQLMKGGKVAPAAAVRRAEVFEPSGPIGPGGHPSHFRGLGRVKRRRRRGRRR